MLIGRLSELTGATRKAIRHYESIGLIPEPKRKGSYRIYSDHDAMVIGMILRAKNLGFSLIELKELVSKKNAEEKLPMELVCSLIDSKVSELQQEIEERLLKEHNLKTLKIDLIKKFT